MPLTITPSSVVIPDRSAVVIQPFIAGVAINAGQMFYQDTTGLAQLCDNTAQVSAEASAIAVNTAAANQPLEGVSKGKVTIATGLLGFGYWIGVGGSLVAESELTGTDFATFIGIITATGVLDIGILVGDTQRT